MSQHDPAADQARLSELGSLIKDGDYSDDAEALRDERDAISERLASTGADASTTEAGIPGVVAGPQNGRAERQAKSQAAQSEFYERNPKLKNTPGRIA